MFYHIGLHPTNPDIMVGGTQDNATPVAQGDILNWTDRRGWRRWRVRRQSGESADPVRVRV